MDKFIQYCIDHYYIDSIASASLKKCLYSKNYPKGAYILRQGDICKYMYFIDSGLVKVFSLKGDKEFILRFFAENNLFSLFDSFTSLTNSKNAIQAIEPTSVTIIRYDDLKDLCKKYHSIERQFRIVAFQTAARMSKRISEMLEEDASERYRIFMEENETIFQRISLGDIAKYLGITQQSLSRIRSLK